MSDVPVNEPPPASDDAAPADVEKTMPSSSPLSQFTREPTLLSHPPPAPDASSEAQEGASEPPVTFDSLLAAMGEAPIGRVSNPPPELAIAGETDVPDFVIVPDGPERGSVTQVRRRVHHVGESIATPTPSARGFDEPVEPDGTVTELYVSTPPPPRRPSSQEIAQALRTPSLPVVPLPDLVEMPDVPAPPPLGDLARALSDSDDREEPAAVPADVEREPVVPGPDGVDDAGAGDDEEIGDGEIEQVEADVPDATSAAENAPRAAPPPPPPAPPTPNANRPSKVPRSVREWFTEIFDDATFQRIVPEPTDEQTRHEVDALETMLGVEPGASVLDLGCGSGRHAVELSTRAFDVFAIDASQSRITAATERAAQSDAPVQLMQSDMRVLDVANAFDAAYCIGATFGCFDDETHHDVLVRVLRALRPGGTFVMQLPNRDYVVARQPSMVWFDGPGWICMEETNVNFVNSRLSVKRTVLLPEGSRREFEYSMRVFSLHEIGQLMRRAGFRVLQVSGQFATTGGFFGSSSPEIIILAQKPTATVRSSH